MTIRILSEHLINQIAAGEVIENPASVVKELVENSLDAGASKIVIEVKGGGHQLIKVSDDGVGMSSDDAVLCLERHATSKIKDAEDLFRLSTMGFRGEALASIAAISKMTVLTSREMILGSRVEVEGGKILFVEPYARTQGTTIEVRSLFYNVPARKKFQKSAGVNAAEISRLVTALSLAYPHAAFELIQQERPALSAPAFEKSSFEEALALRCGQVIGEAQTFKVSFNEGPYCISGLIGTPASSRPNRTGQYLFINRRHVYSPLISYAVRDGFGTRLPEGRHPLFVLHLTLPADLVDVNVHPQKKEVRLHEEKLIRDKVRQAVSNSLQRSEGVELPQFSFPPVFDFPIEAARPQDLFVCREEPVNRSVEFPLKVHHARPIGIYKSYLLLDGVSTPEMGKEGILLIDLLSARSRVMFDSLIGEKASNEKQGLLIPVTVDLPRMDFTIVLESLALIESLGFSVRHFGGCSFIIDAIPPFMASGDIEPFFRQIADELSSGQNEQADQRSRKLAQAACRFAKANKKNFVLEEALGLFEELLCTSSPYQCPLGKPTMAQVGLHELADFFS